MNSLNGSLTKKQAKAIYDLGCEAVIFALLTLAKMMAEKNGATDPINPSTPSGMVPVYKKPRVRPGSKKPGRKEGHPGTRRKKPLEINQRKEHTLSTCPDCGSPLGDSIDSRTRVIEDIQEEIQPVVTEHTIERYYCPTCQKMVEPTVSDALPKSTVGNHLLALSAWLHYGLGNTLSQIVSVLNHHLHFEISEGGLVQMWQRLMAILYVWYEEIGRQAKGSAVLHADETGWRVSGATHWLWCFTNKVVTYYLIAQSRGSPALKKFFTEAFAGTLITDFWGAYNRIVCAARQVCLSHLLRELSSVDKWKNTPAWVAFRKKLKRLLKDAIRLSLNETCSLEGFTSRRARLDLRLEELLNTLWEDADAKRLVKRLRRHRDHIFTFLDQPGVSPDNNHAEREIRPAVIIRKNSLCNRSEKGADTQAVMMSIYRTLKLRGHDPIKTIAQALGEYIETGQLPLLPPATIISAH